MKELSRNTWISLTIVASLFTVGCSLTGEEREVVCDDTTCHYVTRKETNYKITSEQSPQCYTSRASQDASHRQASRN